jgi:general secretion pathway protein B
MSYILDALNKAERERRRGTVPTLGADAVGPQRSPRLAWSALLAVALLANALAYWWLQRTPTHAVTASPASVVTSREVGSISQPAEPPLTPGSGDTALLPDKAVEPPGPSARMRTTPPASPQKPNLPPLLPEVESSPPTQIGEAKERTAGTEAPASAPPRRTSAPYAGPVTAPAAHPSEPQAPDPVPMMQPAVPAPKVHAAHPAPSGEAIEALGGQTLAAPQASGVELLQVPLLEQLPASFRDSLPELRIDALVFSETPSNRMVFIKGRKYREGDTVEGQARIEQIRRDGAILSHQGRQFMVQP